jgi:hypothetical protein
MLGIRSSRAGSDGADFSSSLASQLQQAWLQAQIHSQSPKLQKRGLATHVSVEKRAPYQQFHQVASDLSSIVADHTGMVNQEELYFHKSRLETPEFPKRPEIPQLFSYSRKANLPVRSTSGSLSEASSSTLSCLSSPRSGSLSPSSQKSGRFDGALDVVDYEDSGALDLAGQIEPLVRFLDGLLMDKDVEKKFTSQEGFNYQAMAKELDAFVSPEALELGNSESVDEDYDISWTTRGFLPTEESVSDKLIHAYTCNLNKHVKDVSENVDSSTWIDEQDAFTDHSDDTWDYYLECIREKPAEGRSLSSSLLQDHFFGKEASLDTFSFSPGCVDLKGLLLRYTTLLLFHISQMF